jgi:hypothetical protein
VSGRYSGLRCGQVVQLSEDNLTGLLVRPEVAERQRAAEAAAQAGAVVVPPVGGGIAPGSPTATPSTGSAGGQAPIPISAPRPRRFHGSVPLDAERVGRDAGRIADEVISHLVGLVGSKVKVILEIEAEIPSGVPDQVVRIVTENSRTLKFTDQGFESE